MENQLPFAGGGQWYKGALHVHTTCSDGQYTPEEAIARYKSLDYSFMAYTDHRVYNYHSEKNSPDFIVIPGMEIDRHDLERHCDNHVVVVRKKVSGKNYPDGYRWERPEWTGHDCVQAMIDDAKAHDNLVFYCHPVWSQCELEDFVDYQGLDGIEVYNHGCHVENNTAGDPLYWASLLRRERRIFAYATDDGHAAAKDTGGGFVVVKAPELTEAAIIAALLEGRFFASTGPMFTDYGVRNGRVFVECDPVREIHLMGWRHRGKSFLAETCKTLRHAEWEIPDGCEFVRAEIVDQAGLRAWTQPIWL